MTSVQAVQGPPAPPIKRIQLLSNHIARLEGFYKAGSLAQRQNNPGNLMFAGQLGAIPGDRGFARFPTTQHGFSALQGQIQRDAYRGLTLQQFIYKYAPPDGNNTKAYLNSVALTLGARPNQKLAQIIR